MSNVHPKLIVGSSTEVIAGEKLIVTAGAIDAHIHYICPQQVTEALASGTTTMIGGGTGPSAGTNATTCTPSPFYMRQMLAATDGLPMNFAFTGKGNDSGPKALEDIVKAGAAGLKLHEDWGSTPSAIINCLDVGDEYDVQVSGFPFFLLPGYSRQGLQVNIHTDTLNESGFVESEPMVLTISITTDYIILKATIAAFGGRTIHTYHSEGAGTPQCSALPLHISNDYQAEDTLPISLLFVDKKTFCLPPPTQLDHTLPTLSMNI